MTLEEDALSELYKKVCPAIHVESDQKAQPCKIAIPGPRRVYTNSHSVGLDWEDLLADNGDIRVCSSFTTANLMRNAIRNRLVDDYLPRFAQQPHAVLEELAANAKIGASVEQEIYTEVHAIFTGMQTLYDSDTIAHTMQVRKRNI